MDSDDVDTQDLLGVFVEENLLTGQKAMLKQVSKINLRDPVTFELGQSFRVGFEVAN